MKPDECLNYLIGVSDYREVSHDVLEKVFLLRHDKKLINYFVF